MLVVGLYLSFLLRIYGGKVNIKHHLASKVRQFCDGCETCSRLNILGLVL